MRLKRDESTADQQPNDDQHYEMNKFKRNLRRFEEERRRFELERVKFEKEKRDMVEKQRCRRLEEFERKRLLRQFQEAEKLEMLHQLNNNHHRVYPSSGHDTMESDEVDTIFRPRVIRRKSQGSMLDRYRQNEDQSPPPVAVESEPLAMVTPMVEVQSKPSKQSLLHRLIFGKRSNKPKTGCSELDQLRPLHDTQPITWSYLMFEARIIWRQLLRDHPMECEATRLLRNQCIIDFIILCMFFGAGGLLFRFVEGAFENFYKCGVRRVKRDFVDQLWHSSHNLRFAPVKLCAQCICSKFYNL